MYLAIREASVTSRIGGVLAKQVLAYCLMR